VHARAHLLPLLLLLSPVHQFYYCGEREKNIYEEKCFSPEQNDDDVFFFYQRNVRGRLGGAIDGFSRLAFRGTIFAPNRERGKEVIGRKRRRRGTGFALEFFRAEDVKRGEGCETKEPSNADGKVKFCGCY